MLWVFLIALMLLLSILAVFSDKEGRLVGGLAQTTTVFCLIFAVFFARGNPVLCTLASAGWMVYQLSKSDIRWRH
ncbi:hypothetical protein ACFSR7_28955 [Cohnella sp. GCM10020058]|uniref:hypothetical protein n=1 Tax=Cohnella sp. GCM10020058 TaxID=3317330 RepID=UPI003627B6EE